jgi:hypothetical protein
MVVDQLVGERAEEFGTCLCAKCWLLWCLSTFSNNACVKCGLFCITICFTLIPFFVFVG